MARTEALTAGRRSSGHELLYRRFSLRVLQGPDAGKVIASSGAETTVGTDPGADLALGDRTVSRHHAAIRPTEDGLELRDLGSKNGTFLGGHRVLVAFVQEGSLISCGRTTLRVDLREDEQGEPLSPKHRFGQAVGVSPAMRRVFAMLERIAPTDGTVLLEGETGTGKEALAEAIHDASPRADGPLVVVDMGAISPTLIESELFGHVRGSFTGAATDRVGAFEAAQGGTIFLDEVGELPLSLQPLLLRALEDRTVKRVGENQRIPIDARVIAATHRDLRSAVNDGSFRADLYYRLAVLRVAVPPLRARREDIPLLARHLLEELGHPPARADDPALADFISGLALRSWPGNVRELRSAIERALVVGLELSGAVEPDGAEEQLAFRDAKELAMARWEQEYVRELLARAGGNLAKAARRARMSRSYLSKLVSQYGLR